MKVQFYYKISKIVGILILCLSTYSFASSEQHQGALNPGDVILEHVQDGHSFEFFRQDSFWANIPLLVILYSQERGVECFPFSKFHKNNNIYKGYILLHEKNKECIYVVNPDGSVNKNIHVYDFSLTRQVVQLFIAMLILLIILLTVSTQYKKNKDKAPKGLQNIVEAIVVYIRDEVIISSIGKEKANKYMPFLFTVFFFILINNLLGLIPGAANVTGDISFTMVLALASFVVIELSSNRTYWLHIFWPPGVPFLVKIILVPIEITGIFTKPFALMIRLFANMLAGHIVILCLILIMFIFGKMSPLAGFSFAPVSVVFLVFVYFLELLVAFLQAYIFTNLTAVFIAGAMPEDHHDGEINTLK
ncbi:MAG: F0F1 ATP synthase subunit A [Chitinophagaceae bacterium]